MRQLYFKVTSCLTFSFQDIDGVLLLPSNFTRQANVGSRSPWMAVGHGVSGAVMNIVVANELEQLGHARSDSIEEDP